MVLNGGRWVASGMALLTPGSTGMYCLDCTIGQEGYRGVGCTE